MEKDPFANFEVSAGGGRGPQGFSLLGAEALSDASFMFSSTLLALK